MSIILGERGEQFVSVQVCLSYEPQTSIRSTPISSRNVVVSTALSAAKFLGLCRACTCARGSEVSRRSRMLRPRTELVLADVEMPL